MKTHLNFTIASNYEKGRSIVEVMIALTIGMVILIAVSSLFVTNRQTFRSGDDKTRLDEEGRLALNLMAFHVRMAGYGTILSTNEKYVNTDDALKLNKAYPATYTSYSNLKTGASENAIRGCAGGFANTATEVTTVACAAGTASDAFLVRYVVDQNVIASGGATPTDCLGANAILSPAIPELNGRPGTAAYYVIENRFFVQNNATTGNPELYCRGNGNTAPGSNLANAAQPIAENVEAMKVTYGLSPDEVTLENDKTMTVQNVNQFVTADKMLTPDMWGRVVSVRICIVVRSANNNLVTTPQTYRDCEDKLVTAADRRIRGVFSTTVAIRSRSVGAT
ncbi:PilW family protein [Undibacterium fentianense]|uniref:PilW family protein n=1 Tax=Undibacterium fentianense TaxID=2828728 RepID=A0A941ID98_9BURK|nr:PilW family protein [Undibacterium fentianense]MBR7801079.1 PilW family protein [Undibacterium fentianense]